MAKQKQIYKICTNKDYTYEELEGTPYHLDGYDVDFCIVKYCGYYYIYDTWTGLRACYEGEKNKKNLISKFEKLVAENKTVQEVLRKVKTYKSLQQRIDKHNKILDLKKQFEEGTGVKLCLTFGDTVDVVALDKDIKTPDGVSTYNHIMRTYGKKYSDIISDMLKIDKYE